MSAPIELDPFVVFVAVYRASSFSRAGEALGRPRSTISRSIAALEARLGMALFHRTTRRVTATREADALYDRVAPAVATLRAALEDGPHEGPPSGVLRVTCPVDIGDVFLSDVVRRYIARYPHVRVEVDLSNHVRDLTDGRLDLALRVSGRQVSGTGLKVRRLGLVEMGVYAATQYVTRHVAAHGPISDSEGHPWVRYARTGSPSLTEAPGAVMCNDMFFARAMLRGGAGIGVLPAFVAHDDVKNGLLTPVLPAMHTEAGTLYMMRPDAKHVPPRVRAFQDMVIELFDERRFAPGRAV